MNNVDKKLKGSVDLQSEQVVRKVIYLFGRDGEHNVSKVSKNLILIEKKLAENKLGKSQEKFVSAFSNMNAKQQNLVVKFALAVQEGEASIAAFLHRLQEAERLQSWRSYLPPEAKAKEAERSKKRRASMSPQEAEEYRARRAEIARSRRANLSPEDRAKEAERSRNRRMHSSEGKSSKHAPTAAYQVRADKSKCSPS